MEAALKKVGDRSYKISMEGESVGTLTMKTRIEKKGNGKVVVFEDQMEMARGGEKMQMTMKETAALSHLRILSAQRGGKDMDWSVSVSGNKAVLKVEGREQTVELTEGAVGESGLLRILCAAEQKEKASFKVDVLSMTSERLEKDHHFTCLGKETVEVGGKKIDAFKWEEKGEWKITRNGIAGTSSVDNSYWVSAEGYLVRSIGPNGMEIVLQSK
jgi:hypothetical protein